MTLAERTAADSQNPAPKSRTHRGRLPRWLFTFVVGLFLIGAFAVPARAGVRVFINGVFGLPVYPYAYAESYPYPYSRPCYRRPYGGAVVVVPRAWVPGHWAWRHGRWGRPFRVWVPPHRR